jgi:hypothetical protein
LRIFDTKADIAGVCTFLCTDLTGIGTTGTRQTLAISTNLSTGTGLSLARKLQAAFLIADTGDKFAGIVGVGYTGFLTELTGCGRTILNTLAFFTALPFFAFQPVFAISPDTADATSLCSFVADAGISGGGASLNTSDLATNTTVVVATKRPIRAGTMRVTCTFETSTSP